MEERERSEGEERVAVAAWWLCWLPVVELVFVVVYRLCLLVLSLEKAAVEEVERAAESRRGKKENGNSGEAGFLQFFDPIVFLPQGINGDSIYRRWNRVISSTPG